MLLGMMWKLLAEQCCHEENRLEQVSVFAARWPVASVGIDAIRHVLCVGMQIRECPALWLWTNNRWKKKVKPN